jgi:hypothetical protein
MSTTYLQTVRAAYAAFATGDMPSVLAVLAPDIEWTEAEGFPYGGTYRGPQAVLEGVFMRLGQDWDNYAAIPDDFLADGERVVAFGHYSGRNKATGRSFVAPFAHVWTFRNGKAVRFLQYVDTVLVRRAVD